MASSNWPRSRSWRGYLGLCRPSPVRRARLWSLKFVTFERRLPLSVFLIRHFFHPIDDLAVESFLNRDVGHGCRGGGAVPVFLARSKPDHIAGANLFDRAAGALSPAATGGDDQSLAERMGMPCRASTRFEGYAGAGDECGIRRLKQRIDPHRAGEPFGRSFRGSLRANSFDVQDCSTS